MEEGWGAYQGAVAAELALRYETLDPHVVHAWLRDLLPEPPSNILDIGAGSGRDANWLATLGHDVVALEPSSDMLSAAKARHKNPRIRWLADALPSLNEAYRLGLTFDVILLNSDC